MTRARDLADSADKDIAGTITLDAVNASGVITGLTVEATGTTAAGDNAAMGYTTAEGLILTGQGSTNDVTIKNDANADVIEIPTGTVNVTMAGTLGVVGKLTTTGELAVSGEGTVAVFEATDGASFIQIKDDDGTSAFIGADAGSFVVQTPGNSFATKLLITSAGDLTSTVAGGVFSTRADGGGFTYKQLLDTSTAGVTFSGQSNRGELGQFRILQTGSGADGGYIELKTSPSGSTTPALRMTVENNGDVTIEDGDLVIGTAGHGINFGGAVNASGTVSSSNTLDDYEEGEWTPTLVNGGSISRNRATYTKIGRTVYVYAYIQLTPTNDTSVLTIGGLPFTAKNVTHYYGGGDGPSYSGDLNTTTWGSPLVHLDSNRVYWHDISGTGNTIKGNFFGNASKPLIFNAAYCV